MTPATKQIDMVDPLTMAVDELVTIEGTIYRDVGRAGGGCTCRCCGKLFYDHPMFRLITDRNDQPFLTLLCQNTLVKL